MEKHAKIKSIIKLAGYESQTIHEKVKHMSVPENVEIWINEAIQYAESLPDKIDSKPFILRYAAFAIKHLNEEQRLKEYLYHIQNNIENAKHDLSLLKQHTGAKNGGLRTKHKQWADIVAEWLLNNNPNLTENEVWKKIPDSTTNQSLYDDIGDFTFYRDGDDLVKTQQGIEKKLKKSTFFKNYYRKA
jgi:hypothetical protein